MNGNSSFQLYSCRTEEEYTLSDSSKNIIQRRRARELARICAEFEEQRQKSPAMKARCLDLSSLRDEAILFSVPTKSHCSENLSFMRPEMDSFSLGAMFRFINDAGKCIAFNEEWKFQLDSNSNKELLWRVNDGGVVANLPEFLVLRLLEYLTKLNKMKPLSECDQLRALLWERANMGDTYEGLTVAGAKDKSYIDSAKLTRDFRKSGQALDLMALCRMILPNRGVRLYFADKSSEIPEKLPGVFVVNEPRALSLYDMSLTGGSDGVKIYLRANENAELVPLRHGTAPKGAVSCYVNYDLDGESRRKDFELTMASMLSLARSLVSLVDPAK